jgi:hypothetical protein
LEIGAGTIGTVAPYVGPNSDGGAAYVLQNQALNYQDGDLASVQPLTLECWFWLHSGRGVAQAFLALTDGVANLEIGLDATLHPHAFSSGGGITSVTPVTRQQWHHLVLTQSVAAGDLYLDGFNVGTLVGGAIGAWSPGFIAGAGGSTTAPLRFSTAALAECAIYSTKLSAARVTAHFVAADNTAGRPIYRANGTFDISGGTATSDPTSLASILASVRKVF